MESELIPQEVSKCVSVGFIVHENDEQITIAQSVAEEDDGDDQISGITVIPKSAIRHKHTIELDADRESRIRELESNLEITELGMEGNAAAFKWEKNRAEIAESELAAIKKTLPKAE